MLKLRYTMLLTISLVLYTLTVNTAFSHNNATIHPDITHAAMDLVKSLDENQSIVQIGDTSLVKYKEIQKYRGTLTSPPPPRSFSQVEDASQFAALPRDSIVKGVAMEDEPATNVLTHFYHARTGIPLLMLPVENSSIRARYLFSVAADMFGYTDQSKSRGFYYFGRALHHLQDMSSPAHVHNDPHVYFITPDPFNEKDDYEGRYEPYGLWLHEPAKLANYMYSVFSDESISSWEKVWDTTGYNGTVNNIPADQTLAGSTFNRATYQATLEFPVLLPPTNPPTGELAEMFPCDANNKPENCLHWEYNILDTQPTWVIDSLAYLGGQFHYQVVFDPTVDDDWWAVNWNDGDITTWLPDGIQGEYYIEKLIYKDPVFPTAMDDFTNVIKPNRIRTDYTKTWDPTTNPTIDNLNAGKSLVEIRAQNILQQAVSYSAGFAKWWYDLANTPPYLKKVTAKQDDNQGQNQVKYLAEWQDKPSEYRTRNQCQDAGINVDESVVFNTVVTNTIEQILYVPGRYLVHDAAQDKYISDKSDLELDLEFNEEVTGSSVEVDIAGYNILGDPSVTIVNPDDQTALPQSGSKRWNITVPKAYLASLNQLAGLDPKRTITVKAKDLNNHWGNIGADLDETPETPARRQVDKSKLRDITYDFPWHTSQTVGIDCKLGSNAYDYANGDQNHTLLFDTNPPAVSVQVDVTGP